MTTPYGVTRRSAEKYVVADYLAEGKAAGVFAPEEYRSAARVLMHAVWPAIGDVVVRGREAMAWLRAAAKPALASVGATGEQCVWWETPSGFRASQAYFEYTAHRINTRLHGESRIKVTVETDEIDGVKHQSGMAPNFVHSLDAAHLHLTTAAAAECGITGLAMIHDDYGTHAADSQKLYGLIRQCFVAMYENNDPLAEFQARYPALPAPPASGTLAISEVLRSEFFFS